MATEGCSTGIKEDVTDMIDIDGVVVIVEHGPKILFVDLDGDSSIAELYKSPRLKGCDLYYGDFVIEGKRAPIKKIAKFNKSNKDLYIIHAKYANKKPGSISDYDPSVECKIGLLGYHSKWICHQSDGKVVCNRGACNAWEIFTSVPISKDVVAFKSHRNQLCSLIFTSFVFIYKYD